MRQTYPLGHELVVGEEVQDGVDRVVAGALGRDLRAGIARAESAVRVQLAAAVPLGAVGHQPAGLGHVVVLHGGEKNKNTL